MPGSATPRSSPSCTATGPKAKADASAIAIQRQTRPATLHRKTNQPIKTNKEGSNRIRGINSKTGPAEKETPRGKAAERKRPTARGKNKREEKTTVIANSPAKENRTSPRVSNGPPRNRRRSSLARGNRLHHPPVHQVRWSPACCKCWPRPSSG